MNTYDAPVQAYIAQFVDSKYYKKFSETGKLNTVETLNDFLFYIKLEPNEWTADNIVEAAYTLVNDKVADKLYFKTFVPILVNFCRFLEDLAVVDYNLQLPEALLEVKENVWLRSFAPTEWTERKIRIVQEQERTIPPVLRTTNSNTHHHQNEILDAGIKHHFRILTDLFIGIDLNEPMGNDLLLLKDIVYFRENLSAENQVLFSTLLAALEDLVLQGFSYRQIFASLYTEFPLIIELYMLGQVGLQLLPPPQFKDDFLKNLDAFNDQLDSLTFWQLSWLYLTFASSVMNENKHTVAMGSERPYQAPAKLGRNDLCACGSGKKYKKCCGK